MSQRQQYAIVPSNPEMGMLDAAYIPRATGKDSLTIYKAMIAAAPPPPDWVLSDDQVKAVYHEWLNVLRHADELDLIRMAERAVLTRLTESAE